MRTDADGDLGFVPPHDAMQRSALIEDVRHQYPTAMLNSWNDLALLLIGWLLGLLAPAIVDGVRRRRESRLVRVALATELHELRLRIAVASYYVQIRFGQVDRHFLTWIRSILERYPESESAQRIASIVKEQLLLSDGQIAALAEHHKAGPEGGLAIKKYAAPLLDTRVASLWELDRGVQRALMDVRANLALLDDDVDQARFYFNLTFEHSDKEKRERIDTNLRNAYQNMANRARVVADKITATLETLN